MRPNWDEYFMRIARDAATRATCDRKHVGAVIVRDNNILATGYNGSIPGTPHCDQVGHMMEDGHCVRTVHAESNAIFQAAKHGNRIEGAFLYTTSSPCWPCFKAIASSGIVRVIFGELYRDQRIYDFAKEAKIELVDMSDQKKPYITVTNSIGGWKAALLAWSKEDPAGYEPYQTGVGAYATKEEAEAEAKAWAEDEGVEFRP